MWTSQPFADTSLCPNRNCFTGLRTDPAEMAVSPSAIIEQFDVLVDLGRGDLPSRVDALLNLLLFQAATE